MKTPLLALALAGVALAQSGAQAQAGPGTLHIGRAPGAYMATLAQGSAGMALLHEHAAAPTPSNPFSIAGARDDGNGAEPSSWSLAAAIKASSALQLMAGYADQERAHAMAPGESSTAWVVGANYTVAAGTVLFGYGRTAPEGLAATRLLSIGYAYPLSRRSFVFADASDKKAAGAGRHIDIGIRAAF